MGGEGDSKEKRSAVCLCQYVSLIKQSSKFPQLLLEPKAAAAAAVVFVAPTLPHTLATVDRDNNTSSKSNHQSRKSPPADPSIVPREAHATMRDSHRHLISKDGRKSRWGSSGYGPSRFTYTANEHDAINNNGFSTTVISIFNFYLIPDCRINVTGSIIKNISCS